MSEHKVREEKEAKLLQEKRDRIIEALDKDSDSVVLRSEIIFGAVSTGEGRYGIQCGEYPSGMVKQVSYDLLFRSMMLFQGVEMAKAMAAQQDKRIVTPN